MYARIARFEGGDADRFDEQIAEMRSQMDSVRSGGVPADAPAGLRTLAETVSRFVELIDRESGVSLGMAFARRKTTCVGLTKR